MRYSAQAMQFINELYLLSRRRQVFLTCAGRVDGAGAQMLAHLSVQLLSRAIGARYAHTPFRKVHHRVAGSGRGKWERRWEQLLNLGDGHTLAAEIESECEVVRVTNVDIKMPPLDPESASPLLIQFRSAHFFADLLPDHYYYVTRALHRHLNKPMVSPESRILEIAVHIRRGDLVTLNIEYRIVSDDEVLTMLRAVRQVLDQAGIDYRVSLYSEGQESDFAEELTRGANLFLDHDAQWTFLQLARADVLICTKSGFSHVAGLIGDAWVVTPNFWHTLPSQWLSYDLINTEPGVLNRIARKFPAAGNAPYAPYFYAEDLRPRPLGRMAGEPTRIHQFESDQLKIKTKRYHDRYGIRTAMSSSGSAPHQTWIHHKKTNRRSFARYRIDSEIGVLSSLTVLYRAQIEVDAIVLFNGEIVASSEWFIVRLPADQLSTADFCWSSSKTVQVQAGINSLTIIAIQAMPELSQFRLNKINKPGN